MTLPLYISGAPANWNHTLHHTKPAYTVAPGDYAAVPHDFAGPVMIDYESPGKGILNDPASNIGFCGAMLDMQLELLVAQSATTHSAYGFYDLPHVERTGSAELRQRKWRHARYSYALLQQCGCAMPCLYKPGLGDMSDLVIDGLGAALEMHHKVIPVIHPRILSTGDLNRDYVLLPREDFKLFITQMIACGVGTQGESELPKHRKSQHIYGLFLWWDGMADFVRYLSMDPDTETDPVRKAAIIACKRNFAPGYTPDDADKELEATVGIINEVRGVK